MLSEPEQRRLRQIEQALAAEDPRLARSLQDTGPPARHRRWPCTLVIAAASVLLVLSVVASLPAVGVLSAAAALAAIVLRQRRAPHGRDDASLDPPP